MLLGHLRMQFLTFFKVALNAFEGNYYISTIIVYPEKFRCLVQRTENLRFLFWGNIYPTYDQCLLHLDFSSPLFFLSSNCYRKKLDMLSMILLDQNMQVYMTKTCPLVPFLETRYLKMRQVCSPAEAEPILKIILHCTLWWFILECTNRSISATFTIAW